MTQISGKIQTVTGLINPEDVGITLAHEHLSINFEVAYSPPSESDQGKENMDFSLPNLGWIRQHPTSHKSNLIIDSNEEFDTICDELTFYKKNGGSTIVDNTTGGISRNVEFLKKQSGVTGVNLIAGAGYYVDAAHPPQLSKLSEEEVAQQIETEITEGCDGTNIKAGVIGEIGCSWPLTDSEKKVLRGTACAQISTGCPVIIHPGRHRDAPFEIIRVLQEAGGDISNTIMSHLDRTLHKYDDILEFASLGSYCEWDLFGLEVSNYDLCPDVDMPSDAQRIQRIKWLVDAGFGNKITVAHDIHTKHRLPDGVIKTPTWGHCPASNQWLKLATQRGFVGNMKYGGHGFSHILLNVMPKMLERSFTQQQVDNILIHNPAAWLTFK